MIRVYFDWNVLVNLKKGEDKVFLSIAELIKAHRGVLIIPYSNAHLMDLGINNSTVQIDSPLLESDLSFISRQTQNHCLALDENSEACPVNKCPIELFEELYHERPNDLFIVTEPDYGDPLLNQAWISMINIMKLIPSNMDLAFFDKISRKSKREMEIIEKLNADSSLFNFIKVLSKPEDLNVLMNALRKSGLKDSKIGTDPKRWGNPFNYLTKFIQENPEWKDMDDLVQYSLKNSKLPNGVTAYDYFQHTYYHLDSFGYYKDEKVTNMATDANHAFFGAHCDFYVTDDEKAFQKTKALYEKFKIKTVLCKSETFEKQYIRFKGSSHLVEQDIFSRIKSAFKHGRIRIQTADDSGMPACIYELKPVIKNYFNRLQVNNYPSHDIVTLFKKKENYCKNYWWSEIESLVNSIVIEFGLDESLNGNFNFEKEGHEILENCWEGRTWYFEGLKIELFYDRDQYGICLLVYCY